MIYHWFKDCPHNVQCRNSKETLFTQEVQKCYVQNFLGETLNLAVLDSGCTKTECGQEWLKCYIQSLCDDERKKIQEFTSETVQVWRWKSCSIRKDATSYEYIYIYIYIFIYIYIYK